MSLLNLNIWNVIIVFAGLQGFLLAFLLLSTMKFRKASNYALAVLLISTSMIVLKNALVSMENEDLNYFLYYFPSQLTTLLAASIYFFIQYLIDPYHKISSTERLIFIPVILQAAVSIFRYLQSIFNPSFISSQKVIFDQVNRIDEVFGIVFCFVLFLISLSKLNKYEYLLLNRHSTIENKSLHWMRIVLYIILCLLWTLFTIYNFTQPSFIPMYPVWIGMCILIYWVAYFMYLRRDVFEVIPFQELNEVNTPKPELSKKTAIHFDKLLTLMHEEKLYQDPELNMTTLSETLKLSNGYLSQIINHKTNKNFFDFVNEYRIEEVKRRLLDPDDAHFSILSIGLDAGFKSKSTFNSVFKRTLGKTPSAYRKGL